MSISLEISTKQVNELVDKAVALRATGPLMHRIGQIMVDDTRLNFRASKGPDGTPWAPLKHRKGKPLNDTRRLRNSIDYEVSANGEEVYIGTNVVYAPVHQFGHTVKPKTPGGKLKIPTGNGEFAFVDSVVIPARPFIGIKARQVNKINKVINVWAEGVLNRGST